MKIISVGLILIALQASAQEPPISEHQASERQAASGLNPSVAAQPRPTRKATAQRDAGAQAPITLLGSAPTASPAQSFALNGTLAYVCDENEVTIVNIANPANPQVVGSALSAFIRNTGIISCAIQRGSLVVFADQSNTSIGNNPGFVAFSLANPVQPQLIANTAINKRFFQSPVYIGNYAFVPTAALTFFFGGWETQHGDLISVDLTNFAAPAVVGTLAQPQVSALYGGPNPVLGAVQADSSVVYLGGSSSTLNTNAGVGRLQAVDVSNPLATKYLAQLTIPGTVHFGAPQIQGVAAVGLGNTGGYVGGFNSNPGQKGNIVVATFDVADRRAPALISSVRTAYVVGQGGGATRIGNNLFAFAGVADTAGNPVLLVVDISNPKIPDIVAYPVGQAFTSMQAVGNTLYATLGAGGFATYSIPGGTPISLSCPTSLDALVVFDRGVNVSAAAFSSAKNALKSLTNALHLPSDHLGVVSFDAAASLSQPLTGDAPAAKRAVDLLLPASSLAAYIGGGIAAAQTELTGPRRTPSATPVMIIVSDGRDTAAPNGTATLAAATAAKVAGIRIIALQYGSPSSALMQSIASAPADYYLVP